ncbi:glycosyltransferase family 10 domain-containing protein [Marinimicrobium locisalis]|uniref:glycosyltransferase family 10 domain-containing protein n=1 Tax=Marinimicrobium locisalis TaxID=546022 RepID=UPI003221E530
MSKILVLGRPFHGLEDELRKAEVEYDVRSYDELKSMESLKTYSNVLTVGLNILLNPAQLDTLKRILSRSPSSVELIFWTHEPFWDYRTTQLEYIFGRKIHIFNCYNDRVFFSPFSHYFGVGGVLWRSRVKSIEVPSENFLKERFSRVKSSGRPVCAYATCFHDFRLEVPGSIVKTRNDAVKRLWELGACDVYGKNWTGRWSLDTVDESRDGHGDKSWGQIKVEHSSKNYLFSVCLENSLIKNYVTEKFAQAIESYLIPIYVFGNGLEHYFDSAAALRLKKDGSNIGQIFDQLNEMTFVEYRDRIFSLVNDYNAVIGDVDRVNEERSRPSKELVNFIQSL